MRGESQLPSACEGFENRSDLCVSVCVMRDTSHELNGYQKGSLQGEEWREEIKKRRKRSPLS